MIIKNALSCASCSNLLRSNAPRTEVTLISNFKNHIFLKKLNQEEQKIKGAKVTFRDAIEFLEVDLNPQISFTDEEITVQIRDIPDYIKMLRGYIVATISDPYSSDLVHQYELRLL